MKILPCEPRQNVKTVWIFRKTYERIEKKARGAEYMGLFGRKPKEGTPAFRRAMAENIARRRLRYAVERIDDTDIIIGREGGFNIRDGVFIVFADSRVIFRCNIDEMEASELMSLGGAIITAPDLESGGKVRTILVHYIINY